MRFPRGTRVRLRRAHQREDGLTFPADSVGTAAWGGFSWRCVEFALPYRDTPRTESLVVRVADLIDARQLRLFDGGES